MEKSLAMEEKKDPKFVSQFLDKLAEFLADQEDLSIDEIKEDLRIEGIDPGKVSENISKLVAKKLDEHRLSWQSKAREERLTALQKIEKVKTEAKDSRQILDKISKILFGKYGSQPQTYAQAYFRKLSQITEKDLRSLLEDLERLKLLRDASNKKDE
jgi:DNA-binding transcriptional MerR regulator